MSTSHLVTAIKLAIEKCTISSVRAMESKETFDCAVTCRAVVDILWATQNLELYSMGKQSFEQPREKLRQATEAICTDCMKVCRDRKEQHCVETAQACNGVLDALKQMRGK